MAQRCWRWVDWASCYDAGDHSHGRKIELWGACPGCTSQDPAHPVNLRLDGVFERIPSFDPDFKGWVSLGCPFCGYQGDFYVDVSARKVMMVREVCSIERCVEGED
ncbi:hypothetical protein ES703_49408 [subsurface metagenome]